MGWLIIIALALVAPFLASWLVARSSDRLRFADEVWGSFESHARILLEDRTLSPFVGDFVERVVMNIGNGRFTRRFLFSILLRPLGIRIGAGKTDMHVAIDSLEEGQRKQMFRFMIDAMLYDTLRTAISGAVLRTIVLYWLVAVAKDESTPVSEPQVTPMFAAAGWSSEPAC